MKKSFKIESLVPLSAFLISLCAIAISVVEVRVMNEQKESSVWPRIFTAKHIEPGVFKLMVKNSGVGPAQIRYLEVRVNGEIMKSWSEVYEYEEPAEKSDEKSDEKSGEKSGEKGGLEQSILTNNVILPGELVYPFVVKGKIAEEFSNRKKYIKLKLCYCSIYEKCWVIDESLKRTAGLAVPYPVEACETNSTQQFLN